MDDQDATNPEPQNPYHPPRFADTSEGSYVPPHDLMWLLFALEGRIGRGTYWITMIIAMLVYLAPCMMLAVVFGAVAGLIVYWICFPVWIWVGVATTVKRWHDRDKSGWWTFIVLIPIIGLLWHFVELGCLKGTPGPNRFGPAA